MAGQISRGDLAQAYMSTKSEVRRQVASMDWTTRSASSGGQDTRTQEPAQGEQSEPPEVEDVKTSEGPSSAERNDPFDLPTEEHSDEAVPFPDPSRLSHSRRTLRNLIAYRKEDTIVMSKTA